MFRVLRKYTKAILAVSFVFLMFAFVAGPVLNNWISGNAPASAGNLGNRADVVMTWEGGNLTAGELQTRIARKLSLNRILQTIHREGYEASLDAGIAEPTLTVTAFHSNGTSEARTVQKIVLVEMAKAQGMRITDEDIKTYLFDLGFKRVSFKRIKEHLKQLRVEGRTATADFLFEAVRDEMLAHNYWVSYLAAGVNQLPQERWNNWRQFNDRIVLEAVAIQPDDYLSEVEEPTEKQLLDFYEKYKNSDGRPEEDSNKPLPSSAPAFAEPLKVKLVSLKADFEALRTEAAANISDKEVKEYYEKHKDQMFLAVDLSSSLLEEETSLFEETTDEATEEATEEATDDTTAKSTENESSNKEEVVEEKKAAETKKTEVEEAAKTDDTTTKEASISSSPFRLVAFEQEEDKKEEVADEVKTDEVKTDEVKTDEVKTDEVKTDEVKTDEVKTDEVKTDEVKADEVKTDEVKTDEVKTDEVKTDEVKTDEVKTDEVKTDEVKADEVKADEVKTDEVKADEVKTDEVKTDEVKTDEVKADEVKADEVKADEVKTDEVKTDEVKTDEVKTDEAATTTEPADKDSSGYVAPKYQPLSEVEKDIRSILSYEPATQKLEQKISAAYAELKDVFEKYDLEKIDAEDAGKKEPALPEALANLQAFAEKHGLTLEQHEPLSPWDLQKTEVGQLFEVERFRQPLVRVIFVKDLFLDYEPLLAGRAGRFEPLKTEIVIRQKLTPAQPRPFAEIKELVITAWKQDQAASKALEFATKIASNATKNEATIPESLPQDGNDYEIFESLPFSLYQINPVGGGGQPQIELASPDPITAANYNFILTATNLKKNESKALLNHDKSVAYVLRIKSHTQTPEELRKGFLLESNYWTGSELSFQKSRYQHAAALYQYVREQLNVKELRTFKSTQSQR